MFGPRKVVQLMGFMSAEGLDRVEWLQALRFNAEWSLYAFLKFNVEWSLGFCSLMFNGLCV